MSSARHILSLGLVTMLVNVVLMLVKLVTGTVGNSNALVADGIESASDVVVSLITWIGFYWSLRPPDDNHPFGHGRIESLAGMFSGVAVVGAAITIGTLSVFEILSPQTSPAWYTLPVLLLVVCAKVFLSRQIAAEATERDSRALEGDAWHHRADALTSGAAAIGIAIALIGGEAWAVADDWAALLACVIIFAGGVRLILHALHENLDGNVDTSVEEAIRTHAASVPEVRAIEKCMVRKSGSQYFAELHVEVDPHMTVAQGHFVGHQVKDHLLAMLPRLGDVVIHLEPHGIGYEAVALAAKD